MSNLILTQNQALTMGTREVAKLLNKNHSDIKRSADRLVNSGVLNNGQPLAECEFTTKMGNVFTEYLLQKRDCLILVAQNSPEFTAAIVDRWQELEGKQAPKLPQTFAEALQLAADQAKQLELAAPKVAFVDNFVERESLQNATQVAQSMKLKSANALNKILDELCGIYSGSVKRGRVFTVKFINNGYGEVKQTAAGYPQSLFTAKGIVYLNELLTSEGYI